MENENDIINPEYYSDENVAEQTNKAVDFMGEVFNDKLNQIEYLKLRQIAREIQEAKTMASEDTRARPMWTEIVSRYIYDTYGQDIGDIDQLTDSNWDKTREHLQSLRKQYLDE